MRSFIMILGTAAIFSCTTACNSERKVENTSNVSENNTNMEETLTFVHNGGDAANLLI